MERGKNKRGKKRTWMRKKETHFITLLSCCNYGIYTATIEGPPLLSAASLTAELEKEQAVGGEGALSPSWTGTKHNPISTE